jgi:hypothetical protein
VDKKNKRLKKARELLRVCAKQCDRASVASWEPEDPAECVTFAFYAYENALIAAAEALEKTWTKNHYEKAELAERLVKAGSLKTDVSSQLTQLNTLRKDVSYGEPGESLSRVNLEDLVSELYEFFEEVDTLVSSIEAKFIAPRK